ncbi:MAG: hypothetical protein DWQ08_07800, partial [Proteobacteria bacterium]
QAVHGAAVEAGWAGALLGLGERRDADSEKLWPNRLDGLVCRPERMPAKEDNDPAPRDRA